MNLILVAVLSLGMPVTEKMLPGVGVRVSAERIEWSSESQDPVRLLRVWLRVRIENLGREAIILPRSIESPNGGRVSPVSGSQPSYEFWGTEVYGATRDEDFGSVPDSNRFVLLKPGEAFETLTATGLQVNLTDEEIPKTVLPGTEVRLQVLLELAPRRPVADAMVKALREKWRAIGKLTTGQVWSEAVRIGVPAK